MIRAILFLFFLFLVSPPSIAADSGKPTCFDAVVVAKLLTQDPNPLPPKDAHDPLANWSWPWRLNFAIEKKLLGEMPEPFFTVVHEMHTWLNSDIQYILFWLKRQPEGHYTAIHIELYIVPDIDGEFIAPVGAESAKFIDRLATQFPGNYAAKLSTRKYRADQAWWLHQTLEEPSVPLLPTATAGALRTEAAASLADLATFTAPHLCHE
ncbi:hypothetical protein [Niveispirillum sp. BGYR6]|uniref:hypothetical protein n=1 Tax=Niveispirillum sp. BGYR6 TaxID=2971249 RepID=UPI0022B9C3B3|nr:hypothetical protein [Niveispirillum sp. BGYR6]MDG5497082.1 hypothetical protein [Niveispirillum sp. BGYR6]